KERDDRGFFELFRPGTMRDGLRVFQPDVGADDQTDLTGDAEHDLDAGASALTVRDVERTTRALGDAADDVQAQAAGFGLTLAPTHELSRKTWSVVLDHEAHQVRLQGLDQDPA